ncbi:HNH endonuclease signature motif containing protein [Rugamonas apoptosis]|uniref:HNH endonuclease n=1 Tax=Rugamonas apoptosis TaxID=2758570 RepID=A0A7W2FF30_9BURK|nr:HNH endonuclease [Rugamonas apoptosis]MBA5690551.1 HNH endonuclease [Rugamonas apoptosis]
MQQIDDLQFSARLSDVRDGPANDTQACAAHPRLLLATPSQVWSGAPVHSLSTSTHAETSFPDGVLHQRGPCMYCGFEFELNDLHHINDNHQDHTDGNEGVICALCHVWCHLGELPPGDAYVSYLPGLSPCDVNHLQRAMLVALSSGDDSAVHDARDILNWMASHRDYVQQAWGTDEPATFASAIVRQPLEDKELREIVFADLALVIHPRRFMAVARSWASGPYSDHPVSDWTRTYYSVINAPI